MRLHPKNALKPNFGPNSRQWINVFCKDIFSCVVNNGVPSEHFYLERGFRQGCPLSVKHIFIAMKLLAQSKRRPEDVKGIYIQGNGEVRLTKYADDTSALLADVKSVSNLFDLLSLFEKCSGLKITQANSEISYGLAPRAKGKLQFATSKLAMILIYSLGVHFTHNIELS